MSSSSNSGTNAILILSVVQLEINEAWKVNAAPSDSAGPRKNKTQANYESITYPQNFDGDLGEAELSIPNSNANTFMDFQRTSHISMRLDSVGDPFLSLNPQENLNHDYHQADIADITLCDNYETDRAGSTMFERFERFDIEGDEETLFASENIDIPRSCIPTPPQGTKSVELQDLQHGEQFELPYNDKNEAKQEDAIRQRPGQMRARRPKAVVMDYDQTMIPGPTYQSWLVDPSDIVSREGRNRKRRSGLQSTMKIAEFMKIPSVVNLFKTGNSEIYFPSSLLELFVKSSQRSDDSPCGRTSDRMPLNPPSSSSPPDRVHFMEPTEDLFEAFQSRFDSLSKKVSIEKQRANAHGDKMPPDIFMDVRDVNGVNASSTNLMMTPAHSGDEIRSIPSSGSDPGLISHNSEVNSGRSSKKRHVSDSKTSGNGLEPLAEDLSWHHPEPSFKLSRQSEHGLTPDLLVETGPTQTPKQPISDQSLDHVTDSMRMYLKDHFDTPGSAKQESLNKLTIGMNRKKAASLFYQTTVLATRGHIKVQQTVSYGDILISRGANM